MTRVISEKSHESQNLKLHEKLVNNFRKIILIMKAYRGAYIFRLTCLVSLLIPSFCQNRAVADGHFCDSCDSHVIPFFMIHMNHMICVGILINNKKELN